jgi:lipopolysaccharide transport system ATP-binding protein
LIIMSDDFALSAHQLTKAYRLWPDPTQRLVSPILAEASRWLPKRAGQAMRRLAEAGYKEFHALRDVSFEVKRGEAVGIVGRNGAGKSTLLQLIAGTLQPTAGTIEVRGRVAALLELGAGFNPEFTGRENVFLSGAVLGLSRTEMEARFDSVASFADIGDFIDQPVKTYSSGMMMRLAFAVNTCVDPEILIVDEALSVGDAPFQAKCFRRLRQLIDKGVSLLFVSHDLGTVRSICSRALWLKEGRAELWGEAKEVARQYEKFCWSQLGTVIDKATISATELAPPATKVPADAVTGFLADLFAPNPAFEQSAGGERYGTKVATIRNMLTTDADGRRATRFGFNDTIQLHYLVHLHTDVDSELVLGIRLKDLQDNFVYSVQDIVTPHRLKGRAGQWLHLSTEFSLPLTHGKFIIKTGFFGFADGVSRVNGQYDYGRAIIWDVIENCGVVEVEVFPFMPLCGPAHGHAELKMEFLDSAPAGK